MTLAIEKNETPSNNSKKECCKKKKEKKSHIGINEKGVLQRRRKLSADNRATWSSEIDG